MGESLPHLTKPDQAKLSGCPVSCLPFFSYSYFILAAIVDIISHALGFTVFIFHSSLLHIFLEQCVSWEGEEYSQYLLCIFLVSTERKHPPSDSLSISMNQSALQSAFAEMHQHPHALNRKSFSTNNFK